MTDFPSRLRRALEVAQMTQGELSRRLRERGTTGGSLRSVQNYLSGSLDPSSKWKVDAAEILGVSPGWLVDGAPKKMVATGDMAERPDNTVRCPHCHEPLIVLPA